MKYRICDLRHLRCFVAVGEEQVPPTKGRRGSIFGESEPRNDPRRPASGRIRAMEYRVYSLLEASHAM